MQEKQEEKKYLYIEAKALEQHMALFNCPFRKTSVCVSLGCVCVLLSYCAYCALFNSELWTYSGLLEI